MKPKASGTLKLTMYLRPDQYLWLRTVALQLSIDGKSGKVDVSQIIRDMIDQAKPKIEAALKVDAEYAKRQRRRLAQ